MEIDIWKHHSGETLMRVDGGWSAEMEAAIRSAAFDGLIVASEMMSFDGFGAVADKIRWLHSPDVDSWQGLEKLTNLERITYLQNIPQPSFDLRKLPHLRLLESRSGALLAPTFLNHASLEVLNLDELNVKDMAFLCEERHLRALQLRGSPLKSLAGLERCTALSELHIAGSRALKDIAALAHLPELEILELAGTKNLPDISAIFELKKLRSLIVESSVAKPVDLEWLRAMKHLECAAIWVETAAIDWTVFAELPRLYDIAFYATNECKTGSDDEIIAVLQSAGRRVKTFTRYPKGKFQQFRIEFVPPADLVNPMPFYWYQNAIRYKAKF